MEMVIGFLTSVSFIILIFTASFIEMVTFARIILGVLGLALFVIGIGFCILIEQRAGCYGANAATIGGFPRMGRCFSPYTWVGGDS